MISRPILQNPVFENVFLSDLADQFLTGKGDDMCRNIVKEGMLPLLDFKTKTHRMGPGYIVNP